MFTIKLSISKSARKLSNVWTTKASKATTLHNGYLNFEGGLFNGVGALVDSLQTELGAKATAFPKEAVKVVLENLKDSWKKGNPFGEFSLFSDNDGEIAFFKDEKEASLIDYLTYLLSDEEDEEEIRLSVQALRVHISQKNFSNEDLLIALLSNEQVYLQVDFEDMGLLKMTKTTDYGVCGFLSLTNPTYSIKRGSLLSVIPLDVNNEVIWERIISEKSKSNSALNYFSKLSYLGKKKEVKRDLSSPKKVTLDDLDL